MGEEIDARLAVLQEVGTRLARRRDDLIAAEGEDIGTPCTAAAMEVDLASWSLLAGRASGRGPSSQKPRSSRTWIFLGPFWP